MRTAQACIGIVGVLVAVAAVADTPQATTKFSIGTVADKTLAAEKVKLSAATQLAPKIAPSLVKELVQPVLPKPAPTTATASANIGDMLTQVAVPIERIRAGRVIAVKDDGAEAVSTASVAAQIKDRQVLVEQLDSGAKAIALSPELQTKLFGAQPQAAPAGVQLGYRVTAYQPGIAEPVHLVALLVDQTGLLFDASTQDYSGTVAVALLNESQPEASGDLEKPVSVILRASGVHEIDPKLLKFAQFGPNDPGEITVRVSDPKSETFTVAASANFGASYNQVDLAVARPRISIVHPDPDIIEGWGIGTTTLHVQATDIRSPQGFRVLFGGNSLGLSPNPVELDARGMGTVQWRSSGVGTATVAVATPGFQSQPATVTFEAPWLFLSLAIAGGLVGAYLRGRGREHWLQALAIGAVSAVVMVIAYSVGLRDWVAKIPGGASLANSGEAVVFVLGALAALVGVSALVPGTKLARETGAPEKSNQDKSNQNESKKEAAQHEAKPATATR